MAEEGEDGAAAAAHQGEGGPHVVECGLDGGYFGMGAKDALLEIVPYHRAPLFHGAQQGFRQGHFGLAGRDAAIGLLGRNEGVGLDEHQGPAPQRQVDGRELVANARGKRGPRLNEEGAVGPEPSHAVLHLLAGHTEGEGVVEQAHHGGGIATATAQAGSHRDALVEVDVERRQLVVLAQLPVHLDDEVALGIARNGCPHRLEGVGRIGQAQGRNAQIVVERHGVEHGLKVVIAVVAAAHHIEAEVNLANRKGFLFFKRHNQTRCFLTRISRIGRMQ